MTETQKTLILDRLADAKTRRDETENLTGYYEAVGECDALSYVCGVLGILLRLQDDVPKS